MVELTEKIEQCGLNLKTAHNDIAARENEKKELQDSLKKVTKYIRTHMYGTVFPQIKAFSK